MYNFRCTTIRILELFGYKPHYITAKTQHITLPGNDEYYRTTIGKKAGIESIGNMTLIAAKDINVIGADVKAGGDASLDAENITFDTIVDKTTNTTQSNSGGLLTKERTVTTTTTETNIGSNLVTGGKLTLKSKGDTTIAGSKVDVGTWKCNKQSDILF